MNTIERIDKWHEGNKKDPRPHLGASQIGNECLRKSWYDFRMVSRENFPGRILRLFRHGYTYEPIFIEDLRKIGFTVITKNRKTGKDISFKDHNGHFCGSVDGMAKDKDSNEWILLEFKTHSEKSFNKLKKVGVLKSKPQHYSQMQVYMHYMKVQKGLYLAVNKNTDELYHEIIEYKEEEAVDLINKASAIINSIQPPPRAGASESTFICKFCPHKDICYGKNLADNNCRTCVHSSPAKNGKWGCGMHEEILDIKDQLKGCTEHEYLSSITDALEDGVGERKSSSEKDYFNFMIKMQKEFNAKVVKQTFKK